VDYSSTLTRRHWILAALLLPALLNLNAAEKVKTETTTSKGVTQKIVVGGGCFWCVEAVLQRLPGVKKIVSGYSGGHVKNPTYEQICTKTTGHAEVVEVEFDPATVKLDTVLDVFFVSHDPTTLNRQGADVGPQYRSVVYYTGDEQKKAVDAATERAKKEWSDPIVTEIAPLKEFYAAEDYHQNYYNLNKDKNPYCSIVIGPKLRKMVEKGVIKAE
jgi:peptide-methionine (S)-S-oxide reductase